MPTSEHILYDLRRNATGLTRLFRLWISALFVKRIQQDRAQRHHLGQHGLFDHGRLLRQRLLHSGQAIRAKLAYGSLR